jgi:hypothetical protein
VNLEASLAFGRDASFFGKSSFQKKKRGGIDRVDSAAPPDSLIR